MSPTLNSNFDLIGCIFTHSFIIFSLDPRTPQKIIKDSDFVYVIPFGS